MGSMRDTGKLAPIVHCTRILLNCLRYLIRSGRAVARKVLSRAVGTIEKHTDIGVPPMARMAPTGLHRVIHRRHHVRLTVRNVHC